MASVTAKKNKQGKVRRGCWQISWRGVNGKRKQRVVKFPTKTQARRLADELEHNTWRQREGLAPDQSTSMTLAAAAKWWLRERSPETSHQANEGRWRNYCAGSDIAEMRLGMIRTPDVARHLAKIESSGALGPSSINKVHSLLSSIFRDALEFGLLEGANPARGVTRRKVPKTKPDWLPAPEARAVLQHVAPQWFVLFAMAVYTGMRKGELLALQRVDVYLGDTGADGKIRVRRSNANDKTKNWQERVVPIHSALHPILKDHLDRTDGKLVIPNADGGRFPADTKLTDRLRTAMKHAGIVERYDHKCRRCGHVESHADGALRQCPKGCMKLWPKAVVRPVCFKHLRATTASLLINKGCDIAAITAILGHSSPRITWERYAHIAPDYLHKEIELLTLKATEDDQLPDNVIELNDRR